MDDGQNLIIFTAHIVEIADKEKAVETGYIQHKPSNFFTRLFKPA
jgi:hypothetical protein